MADLRTNFVKAGYSDPKTYIQTGNVVFEAEVLDLAILSDQIQQQILADFGFEVPVLVLLAEQIQTLLLKNPFLNISKAKPEYLHITFLKEEPKPCLIEKIQAFESSPDQFQNMNKVVFVYCPRAYRETKLGNTFFEKQLKVQASTRTWKTVLKLSEMLE